MCLLSPRDTPRRRYPRAPLPPATQFTFLCPRVNLRRRAPPRAPALQPEVRLVARLAVRAVAAPAVAALAAARRNLSLAVVGDRGAALPGVAAAPAPKGLVARRKAALRLLPVALPRRPAAPSAPSFVKSAAFWNTPFTAFSVILSASPPLLPPPLCALRLPLARACLGSRGYTPTAGSTPGRSLVLPRVRSYLPTESNLPRAASNIPLAVGNISTAVSNVLTAVNSIPTAASSIPRSLARSIPTTTRPTQDSLRESPAKVLLVAEAGSAFTKTSKLAKPVGVHYGRRRYGTFGCSFARHRCLQWASPAGATGTCVRGHRGLATASRCPQRLPRPPWH